MYIGGNSFGKDRISVINPTSTTQTQRTLSVLDKAKAGILERIINPAGGYTDFEYELNRFNYFNKEYLGAGLRVKNKTINDRVGSTSNNIVYSYKYTQITDDAKSSGFVSGIPAYAHICKSVANNATSNQIKTNTYTASRRLDYPIGNEVGYNRVLEATTDGGYTEYIFTSTNEFSDKNPPTTHTGCSGFLGTMDHFPYVSKTSFDYKRGLLLSERVFTKENNFTSPIYSIANIFSYNLKKSETFNLELNTGPTGNTGIVNSERTVNSEFVFVNTQTEFLDGVQTIFTFVYNDDDKLFQKITNLTDNETTK